MKLRSDFTFNRYGLNVRLVNEEDAEFIVNLRTDPQLGMYLCKISNDIDKQIEWIREYKKREIAGIDYYFIYYLNGLPIGVNRILNIGKDSWMGGSLVFKKNCGAGTPILAALIQYYIAFEILDKYVHFGRIFKNNKKGMKFNRFLGVDVVCEDENEVFIILTKKIYLKTKDKLEKIFLRPVKKQKL